MRVELVWLRFGSVFVRSVAWYGFCSEWFGLGFRLVQIVLSFGLVWLQLGWVLDVFGFV